MSEIECSCCYDDFKPENIVNLKAPDGWFSTDYCEDCFMSYFNGRWKSIKKNIYEVDCYGALKRLLAKGIPTHFSASDFLDEDLTEDFVIHTFRVGHREFAGDFSAGHGDHHIDLNEVVTKLQNMVDTAQLVNGKPEISQMEIRSVYYEYFGTKEEYEQHMKLVHEVHNI